MTTDADTRDEGSAQDGEPSLSLLEISLVVAERKRAVLKFLVASFVASLIVAFALPLRYTAATRLLPPQQSQSTALAMLGQLGPLASGTGQALGIRNPTDMYVAILRSRTVADKLIDRFDLKKIYNEDLLQDARKELANNSAITGGRDGVIAIEVEDKDPKRAADIANAYVEELRRLTSLLAVTEAGQRRVFFEDQLKKAKNDLIAAETDLKKFSQTSGLINPQSQIGLSVSAAAALRAQIAAKEIQLSAMRTFATNDYPEYRRALQELMGLRAELSKMEQRANVEKGDVMVPFAHAPEVGLEYVRRYRETKYYETLFEAIAKQYEIARIDEAKDAILFQVLDLAVLPEKKSKPKRTLIVALSTFAGLLLGIVVALISEGLRRSRTDPIRAQRLDLLKRYLTTR